MNLIRKLAIPAIAAVAVLSGTSTALAATSSPAAVTSAAHPSSAVSAATASSPNNADGWYYYSNYPTLNACAYVGIRHGGYGYNCVEMNEGYYTVWYLYFWA